MRKNKLVFLLTTLALVACFVTIAFVGCTNPIDKAKDVVDSIVSDGLVVEAVTASVDHEVYLSANTTSTVNGVELTASISPSTATGYTLVWSTRWKTGNEWSNGKDVANYMTLTVDQQNANKATVAAVAAFGCPIEVVCSVQDTNKYAVCEVGYGQRLTDAGAISIAYGNGYQVLANTNSVYSVPAILSYGATPNHSMLDNAYNRYVLGIAYGSTYTAANAHTTVSFAVKPSSGLYTALQAQNIANAAGREFVSFSSRTDNGNIYCITANIYESLSNLSSGNNAPLVTDVEKFNSCVVANQDTYDFELKATVVTDYETMVYIYQLQFDRSSAVFTVQGITISPAPIVL